MSSIPEKPGISDVRYRLYGRVMSHILRIIQVRTFPEALLIGFTSTFSFKTRGRSVGHWPALSGDGGLIMNFSNGKALASFCLS